MDRKKLTITLDDANRLTLPADLIDRLGLKPGSSVDMEVDADGRLLLTPVPEPPVAAPPENFGEAVARKNLETPMQFIKGVGPKLAEAIARRGVVTVEDALYLLPHRYEDRRELRRIAKLRPGLTEVFAGEVQSAGVAATKGGRRFYEAVVSDGSGSIILKWFHFNAAFLKKSWIPGRKGIFTGEVSQYDFQREIHHPEVEWLGEGEVLAEVMARDPVNFGRIVPVYPALEGLHQKTMRKIMKEVVDRFAPCAASVLPGELAARHALVPLPQAFRETHFPERDTDLEHLARGMTPAHRTLVFDELFFLELGLALKRQGFALADGISFNVTHKYTKPLLQMLPFALTGAQNRVLSEIKADMMSPHPMHRLVQGDVGSGKTLVALMAALVAVENDYQVAIMAPTEILAEQHYLNIHRWCDALGVRVVLLTASLKGKAKTAVLQEVATGEAQIVIGTHAVIQEKVDFQRLGLGIIDEQHRFGVAQRNLLKQKGIVSSPTDLISDGEQGGEEGATQAYGHIRRGETDEPTQLSVRRQIRLTPDILVMTATPIPRTLAMTVYGDLSLSVIDELPPGRTPVETKICYESRRLQVYSLIREEIHQGGQAYVIYPLVEESEKSDLKAATQMAEHLTNDVFPEFRLGILHGRMKPEEKEAVMRSFKAGEIRHPCCHDRHRGRHRRAQRHHDGDRACRAFRPFPAPPAAGPRRAGQQEIPLHPAHYRPAFGGRRKAAAGDGVHHRRFPHRRGGPGDPRPRGLSRDTPGGASRFPGGRHPAGRPGPGRGAPGGFRPGGARPGARAAGACAAQGRAGEKVGGEAGAGRDGLGGTVTGANCLHGKYLLSYCVCISGESAPHDEERKKEL